MIDETLERIVHDAAISASGQYYKEEEQGKLPNLALIIRYAIYEAIREARILE